VSKLDSSLLLFAFSRIDTVTLTFAHWPTRQGSPTRRLRPGCSFRRRPRSTHRRVRHLQQVPLAPPSVGSP
jgi:hypothetical protein